MSYRVRGDQQSYQQKYIPRSMIVIRMTDYERRQAEKYIRPTQTRDITDKLKSA